MKILIMGVSGTGKSTLGNMLSKRLGIPFLEADDFHPEANREKLKKGQPLTEQERLPWLKDICDEIIKRENQDLILACSALKQRYRKVVMQKREDWFCIFLRGSKELIRKRVLQRKGHFFNPVLLENQFITLEEPQNAVVLDVGKPVEHLMNEILGVLTGESGWDFF